MATHDDLIIGRTPEPSDDSMLDGKRTDLQIVRFELGFDLVPEWSNVLENICQHHAESTKAGVLGDQFVVKAAVAPEKREELMAIVQRMWNEFARRRKLRGDWKPERSG